jgi:hypothetical protein
MKHKDKNVAFEESWACLRQPGSQWVTSLLCHSLNSGGTRPAPVEQPREHDGLDGLNDFFRGSQ